MTASGKAEVSFVGIDLTPHVRSIVLDAKSEHAEVTALRIAGLADVTVRVRGSFDPRAWRQFFVCKSERVSRLRSAYGRRRGRGRW